VGAAIGPDYYRLSWNYYECWFLDRLPLRRVRLLRVIGPSGGQIFSARRRKLSRAAREAWARAVCGAIPSNPWNPPGHR
jgi:hypothetical protein